MGNGTALAAAPDAFGSGAGETMPQAMAEWCTQSCMGTELLHALLSTCLVLSSLKQ